MNLLLKVLDFFLFPLNKRNGNLILLLIYSVFDGGGVSFPFVIGALPLPTPCASNVEDVDVFLRIHIVHRVAAH